MAKLEQELSNLLNEHPDTLKGTLGLNPSTIKVSNRPGYVWVRMLDNPNERIKAYNNVVSPTYNLPVILSYNGRRYEVVKVDIDRYEKWPTNYVPYHGAQHSATRGHEGQDIVWVDSQQFLPLLVVPDNRTGTNSINVWSSYYQDSAGAWSMVGGTGVGNFISQDATGSTLYLVMLNDSTKELYTITGSVLPANVTGTQDILSYTPAIPASQSKDSPLALVKVRPNYRIMWRDIYNLRRFIHPISEGQTSAYVDLSDQVGATTHYDLPSAAQSIQIFKDGQAQAPACPTLDADGLGFSVTGTYPPGTQLFAVINPTTGIDTLYPSWVGLSPDNTPQSANAADDEFEDLVYFNSRWTWLNQSTCTVSLANSHVGIVVPAEVGINLHGIEQLSSGSTWKYRSKLGFQTKDANFFSFSIYLRDSSTGRILTFALDGRGFAWRRFTSPTALDSESIFTAMGSMCNRWMYLELEKLSATSYKFRGSFDGAFFQDWLEYDVSSWLASVDRIGLCWFNETNFQSVGIADWFRRIS